MNDKSFSKMKNLKSIIALLVLIVFSVNAWGVEAVGTFTKVTDASTLAANDEIIIVADAADYALSTTQNTNNRGQAAVTKSDNEITLSSGSNVQLLTLSVKNSHFEFNTGDGYLYAASSSSNYLKTQNSNNANGEWTISIGDKGVATITAQGTNSHNVMQYNSGSSLFSCYSSASQGALTIYKKAPSCTPAGTDLSITSTNTIKTGKTITLASTGGNGGTVEWSVESGTGSASISNGILTAGNVGTVTVKAHQDQNGQTCETDAEQTVTITAITYTDYITECSSDPSISVSAAEWSGFTYIYSQGPSAAKMVTVYGSYLDNGVTVTASGNYEICLSQDGSYTNTLTLTPADQMVNAPIYVRLKAGKDVNSYNGTLTVASSGLDSKNVTLSGSVSAQPLATPSVTATPDVHQITLSWAAVPNADSYQLIWNGGTPETVTSPVTKTNLTGGQSYSYSLIAVGSGNYSNSAAATGTPTAGKETFTVTFNNNGSTDGAPAAIQVEEGGTLGSNLPGVGTMIAPISGYTFVGWVNHNNVWSGFEPTLTQTFITGNEIINADVTYDAVWAKSTNDFELMGNSDSFTDGNYIITYYSSYYGLQAMGNVVSSSNITTIEVDDQDEGIISNNTEAKVVWTLHKTGTNTVTFYNADKGQYLQGTSSALSFTNTPVDWTWSMTPGEEGYAPEYTFSIGTNGLYYWSNEFQYHSSPDPLYIYKQQLNNFFVTTPNEYTVTWHKGNAGTATSSAFEGQTFADIVADAPEVADNAAGDCANKFMGWATESIASNEGVEENAVVWAKDNTIPISGNVDYYAVFAQAEGTVAQTAAITSTDISGWTSMAYATSYNKTSADGTEWSMQGVWTNSSNVDNLQMNSTSDRAITTPEFASNITKIEFNAKGKDITIYDASGNEIKSQSLGSTTDDYVIDMSDVEYNQVKIANKTSGVTHIYSLTITYGSATYSNYVTQCTPPVFSYTLTYAGIGGYGTSCDLSTKHTCDESITACTPDARDGYTFNGWTRSDEEAPIAAGEEFNMPCHDLTLTATWDSLVTFYVQGAIAETQTIDADKHVTGYTPTATCTGKQFMGWSTVNQTELIQDPTSLNLFTDFSSKEFAAPTNLYAVYASINGGKITGKATHDDNVSSYVFSPDVKTCPMQYATYTLDENTKFQNSQINSKNYIGFKLDASKADAHFTTTKIKDLKSISFDYITNGAAISYYIMISADGTDWTKITDNVTLLSTNTTTHALDAIEVPQGDYYVKVGVTQHTSPSKCAVITKMSYTTATRAIWYSDYFTSCTMATSATISYNNKYSYAASSVGETITISNDSHVATGYQLYSLKINGVTYNVGDSYILAHDVTPEAADIRPIITWTERYSVEPWKTTTAPNENGKLVLPETQPASFAPGLYEFDGWTAEVFSTEKKTEQPTYVTAETDAPAKPTTYYAVYRKQNNTGDGYTYRQTTPLSLHTITYHANGGTGNDYVVYTDLSTSTTPTAEQAGLAKEGATLVGWTLYPNADEIVYVAPGTGLTGIDDNRDYYAVWIGSLVMNKAIALTSAQGATVGSTSFTLSSTDLGTITTLRFAYHDVDNNIWYRTTERSKSEFRLCNESYNVADATNLDVSTISTNFSQTYTITYAPNSGNKMSHYKLVVELLNKSKVMAADTFDLTGRALPNQFVIATQKDSKWYALQANMPSSKGWPGVPIEVEDGFAFASDTLLYSLRTYNSDKTHVLFQSAYKQGHLWAASGTETGIRNFATTISGENNSYAWLLTSENDLQSYTVRNKQDKPDHQYLGMNGSNMGMYQLLTPMQFYFLPLGYKEDIVIDSDNTLHDFDNYDLSHADVVVKPNATLTIDQSVTTKNVTVETGGKLNITGGTLTVDNLHLEGGWNEGHTLYDVPNVYIAPEASLAKKIDVVNLDIRVDKRNYYPLAVPFPVPVSSINYVDPVLSAASTYGTHYVIKTYDGALRAENGMDKENNWVAVSEDATLQPGVGYILTAVTPAGYDSRIRFPMTFTNAWTTNGEQGKVEGETKNQSTLYQFESYIHSCHSGWNMVAVPFMSAYGNGENTTLAGVNYVTIPTYDFSEYKQVEVAETILRPEWSFFIQTGSEQKITFLTEQERLLPTPLSAPQRVNEAPEYAVAVRLSSATNSDKTTLKISNRYTTAYEIGADLEKMFGNGYTLATYTIVGGTRLAYNALSEEEAHTLIPVGYRAPEAGTYTFALDITDEMAAQFERLDLIDYETGELTNLMTGTYTFTTERTQSDERFAINATIRKVPTDLDDGAPDRNDGVQKVIYDDHLYIIDHNKVYDGTGSLITIKVGSTN